MPTPPPPPVPLARATVALGAARRQRAEWLIGLDAGLVTPTDVVVHAATEPGRALRRLTLRQVLTSRPGWGPARAGEVLTRLRRLTGTPDDGPALTVGWLVDSRSSGHRFHAWFDVMGIDRDQPPWPGFPFTDPPGTTTRPADRREATPW